MPESAGAYVLWTLKQLRRELLRITVDHFRSISMFSLLPLWETAIMMPRPMAITTPITVHVVERGQNAANEDNETNEIHNRPFHN